jgi:hypothetical protein
MEISGAQTALMFSCRFFDDVVDLFLNKLDMFGGIQADTVSFNHMFSQPSIGVYRGEQ